jgi:hypothetical protein
MIQPPARDPNTTFRAKAQIISSLKMTLEQNSMPIPFPRLATVKAGRIQVVATDSMDPQRTVNRFTRRDTEECAGVSLYWVTRASTTRRDPGKAASRPSLATVARPQIA